MDFPSQGNQVPGRTKTTKGNIFERPQVLLSISTDNKLILEKDTFDQIECIKDSIIVVCVVGKYRTGKSWILNRMLELKQGDKGILSINFHCISI